MLGDIAGKWSIFLPLTQSRGRGMAGRLNGKPRLKEMSAKIKTLKI